MAWPEIHTNHDLVQSEVNTRGWSSTIIESVLKLYFNNRYDLSLGYDGAVCL
jgi:hypothetical protein